MQKSILLVQFSYFLTGKKSRSVADQRVYFIATPAILLIPSIYSKLNYTR